MKLLIMALLLVVVQTAPPIPRKAADRPASSSNRVKKQTVNNKTPAAPATPVPNPGAAEPNQGARNRPSGQNAPETIIIRELPPVSVTKDWWDRLYVIFCGLLVAAGIGGAGLALRTLRALESQVQASINSDRAWVLVTRVGNPPGDWLDLVQTSGYTPGILFEFAVFGHTTVTITNARFILRPAPVKDGVDPPEPDLPEGPDYTNAITNPSVLMGNVLPPKATIQIRENLHNLTGSQLTAFRDGRSVLCGYGFVTYRDAFGNDRYTGTCYVYDFARGGVLTAPDGTVLNPPGFRAAGPAAYHRTT